MQTIELKNTTTTHNSNLIIKPTNVRNKRIPQFPNFKPLELSDREEIEEYVRQFPPYSDFNFVSLWCWNVNNATKVAWLNNNLVIEMDDYNKNHKRLTFLGANKILHTIGELLQQAEVLGINGLSLVPEHNIINTSLISSLFCLQEDIDQHDYVQSVTNNVRLLGKRFAKKRQMIHKFERENKWKVMFKDSFDLDDKKKIEKLYEEWLAKKKRKEDVSVNELKAISRCLELTDYYKILGLMLYIENDLVGFVITQMVHNDYVIGHFAKANIKYKGIWDFMLHKTNENYLNHDAIFFNYEQDLGVDNLRISKQKHSPHHYLKKYIINHKKSI